MLLLDGFLFLLHSEPDDELWRFRRFSLLSTSSSRYSSGGGSTGGGGVDGGGSGDGGEADREGGGSRCSGGTCSASLATDATEAESSLPLSSRSNSSM